MIRTTLFVALLLTSAVTGARAADTLYDRIGAKLAADPALAAGLGKPAPQMQSVSWMIGSWDIATEVRVGGGGKAPEHGTSTVTPMLGGIWLQIADAYPSGTQDLGYFTYNAATESWTGISLDNLGNDVVTHGADWRDGALVLTGEVTIVGVHAMLRQTVTRQNDDAYTVTNEEQGADGNWTVLDTYRYTRRP